MRESAQGRFRDAARRRRGRAGPGRTAALAAALLLSAAATTGCGGAAEGPGAADRSPGDGSAFVRVVRDRLPEVAAGRTDEQLADLAFDACEGLSEGRPATDVLTRMRSLGDPPQPRGDEVTGRELVKLAIDETCPDQAPRVTEF